MRVSSTSTPARARVVALIKDSQGSATYGDSGLDETLQAIRDEYAIYGFSGSGREECEFYVVKDAAGKEVRLHVDKSTKLEGSFKAGDKVEVVGIRA